MSLKIHFYIRPNKVKKNGEAPIYLRLTGNIRKEHSIGYSILSTKWDKTAYKSKGKKPSDFQLNHHIQSMIGTIRRIETNLMNEGEQITVNRVLEIFLGKGVSGYSLIDTYQEVIAQFEQTVGLPDGMAKKTLVRYRTVLKHLKSFLAFRYGKKDIGLSELKFDHIKEFDHFLQTQKYIQNNTRVKHISYFRHIIREAIAKERLEHDPFAQWKGKYIRPERVKLTEEEIKIIRNKELHSNRLGEVRDVFIFCCYTGLAYIDAYNLREEHLIEQDGKFYIQTYRQKTKSKCWIPLLSAALDILDRYEESVSRKIEGRLLPVKSNQKMNSYLKEIAAICGIEKKLTFHIARHTFATTITLANDVPIETVSEMLGHTNISTTQHYAKMIQKKVDRDMDKLSSILDDK